MKDVRSKLDLLLASPLHYFYNYTLPKGYYELNFYSDDILKNLHADLSTYCYLFNVYSKLFSSNIL